MTPVQQLGYRPDDSVIVHEIGHMLVGLGLMIPGTGIVFSRERTDILAGYVTVFGSASPWSEVQVILAGPIAKALSRFGRAESGLQSLVLHPTLFMDPTVLVDGSNAELHMLRNGWQHDWAFLKKRVSLVTAPAADCQKALVEAHKTALARCRSRSFATLAKALFVDIRKWLDAENQTPARPEVKGQVLYPVERALAQIAFIEKPRWWYLNRLLPRRRPQRLVR